MKIVYVLTVWYLSLSNPPKLWYTEQFETLDECQRWAYFYNEYPFAPICKKIGLL